MATEETDTYATSTSTHALTLPAMVARSLSATLTPTGNSSETYSNSNGVKFSNELCMCKCPEGFSEIDGECKSTDPCYDVDCGEYKTCYNGVCQEAKENPLSLIHI